MAMVRVNSAAWGAPAQQQAVARASARSKERGKSRIVGKQERLEGWAAIRAIIVAYTHAQARLPCPPTITDFLGKSFLIATWISPSARSLVFALPCAAVLAAAVPSYPLGPLWLGAALLAYGAALLRWPNAWLLLVPAALPVLDLTPWTGRFYLDEFDAMLAVTVLVLSVRGHDATTPAGIEPRARRWLALFCLSTLAALVIGAWPFHALGLNSFNHYYSPWNGARLAKGLGWALMLWPSLREALARDVVKTQRRFALGMGLGVSAAALAVMWERAAFPGLLNFDSGYRVVGLFSAMHTGGACIEAYFALALPFVAWWTLSSRRWPQRLAGAAMLGAGSYALLVTYARAGYLAALAALLVLALAPRLRPRRTAPHRALRAAALVALLATLAWTVGSGEAMQRRFSSNAHDLALRAGHWVDALRMIDRAPAAWLAGMGLGRYPRTYFQRSEEGVAPTYLALQQEAGNRYVALAAGAPVYLEQLAAVAPGQRYQLRLRVRSADTDAEISVPVCEKWMLYSRRCNWLRFAVGDTGGAWRELGASFTRPTRPLPWHGIGAPAKLSLTSEAEGSRIDIDEVSLRDGQGRELLRNGDFSDGMDRWFFSSDNHLPWHLENTWVQLAFEQGLAGLATFAGLLACAALALWRRLRAGDPYAPALAAALAGFVTLSLLDSVFDFPRISVVVFLLLLQAVFNNKKIMHFGM
jgi:hypothetical protein